MVEQIEELCPELQTHALVERQREVLDHREVCVHKTRAINRCAGCGAELADRKLLRGTSASRCGGESDRRRLRKSAGIEPVLFGVNLGWGGAARIGSDGAGLVRITHLIRSLEGVAVVGE